VRLYFPQRDGTAYPYEVALDDLLIANLCCNSQLWMGVYLTGNITRRPGFDLHTDSEYQIYLIFINYDGGGKGGKLRFDMPAVGAS
jgi:hypothetical protein